MKMSFVWRAAYAVSRSVPLALLVAWLSLVAESRAQGDACEDRFEGERTALLVRRAAPEAAADLAALVRMDAMLSPGRLAAVLRDFVEAQGAARADPLVAAHASYFLSLEEDRSGQHEQADSRRRGLGLLSDLWVLGPFDALGRSGLDRIYPAELAPPDPRGSQCYPGKTHEACWRRTSAEVARQGAIMLGALLRPDNDAVAYVLAYVHSDRGRWAALRLGSPGPVKAWLNGRLVMSRDVVRPAALDQDSTALWLPRGESALLVKTVITAGTWQLFLRLTDPQGAPLPGVTASAEKTDAVVATAAHVGSPPVVRDLKEIMRQRAEHAPKAEAASRWLDFARVLDLLRSEDRESKAAEIAAGRAVSAEPASPATRFAALVFLGQAAREEDDARQALERALALAPGPGERALVLAEIGDLAQQQRRPETALQRWREAAAADPTSVPAQLALSGEEREVGLYAAALRRLDALSAPARRIPAVREARARALEALGRLVEAEAERRQLWDTRRSEADLLRDLAGAAHRRGDQSQAARLYGDAAEWRPDLHFLSIEQARMLEGVGRSTEAEAVLRRALLRLPDEPRLHEELGRLLARMGRVQEAAARLRRSLRLRPQQPALRRYAESLAVSPDGVGGSTGVEDLARRFAADGAMVSRPALLSPPAAADRDPAVILLDRHVTRVHPNGLADVFVQRIVHLRTERAARDSQEMLVRYVPGEQDVEIREARVLRRTAAGEVESSRASGRDDRDLSEPWYGLYYDARAEVVTFENLRAGDVIEVQYTVADVAYQNDMADYFGELAIIGDVLPKRNWDYTLIAPAQRKFTFNQPRLPGLKRQVERQKNEVVYRWAATDVARVDIEPAMPGFTEVAPYLHISTYQSWQEVGRWYWSLVVDQLRSDPTIKQVAAEVTSGLHGDAEKVRALHRFVIEKTRYVGLEFGIHGYKPYPASQVLLRGFGDCKDKSLLLVALLREQGIESELVLLRSRRAGLVDSEPASLAIFDHAITYVPSLDLYLDGTAEFAGLDELPSQDQGVMILRVGWGGTTLARTPVLPASANRAARVWKVALAADGSAQVDETVTVKGQAAQEWRAHYQTPGERRERYAKVWNGHQAGARLEAVEMAGVEDRNQPVVVRARAFVPHLAQPNQRGELHLPSSSREADLTQTYARLGARRWPLVLGFPWQHDEEVEYRLPNGFHLLRAPTGRQLKSAFGSFVLEVEASSDGRAIKVHSILSVERDRIAASEYGDFRGFLRDVDNLLGEPIVIAGESGR
jgi:transglutaminase-like putative cysteine protease/tetratricopeptide (TPR) repeat protein